MQTIKLSSGAEMPVLGLGTWQMTGEECRLAVLKAVELGYTAIDTAWIYQNQNEIGEALKELDRSKLFITSKLWNDMHKYEDVIKNCNETIEQLDIEYLDLFLIHWPNKEVPEEEKFRALKELHDQGKIKNVGVSNYPISFLKKALEVAQVPIVMNQVEFHPGLYQKDLLDFCNKHNIALTAYCPIAKGRNHDNPVLQELSQKYSKTPAQISLRWLIQHGIFIIPKSSSEEHLKENKDIFDFELSGDDMIKIDNMDPMERICDFGYVEWE